MPCANKCLRESMADINLIKNLSEILGPSGFEDRVRSYIKSIIREYADEVFEDIFGNLYARIGEGEPRLMIAAHMDEVGFMVRHITENGFLKVVNLGGINPASALGAEVAVMTPNGDITGVIGSIPPHLMRDGGKPQVTIKSLFVDVGALSRKEVEEMGIRKGTPITFICKFKRRGNTIIGKAFDDRLGCAALIELIRTIERPREGSVYIVFTVQEEVGTRGAAVAAYRIHPKVALSIEGTIAADIPGVEPEEAVTFLGKGPSIRIMDAVMIANQKLFNLLIDVAESNNIKYQIQLSPKSGTDAGRIQYAREGVAVSNVSVPTRYSHYPASLVRMEDYEGLVRLLEAAIPKILEAFR